MKLSKTYEPSEYEQDIYALWEKQQAFAPEGEGQSFSLVLPPPNANGSLHLGQALTVGLEDIAVRYHRLLGERTLFVPGADHAGFETWVVYEKKLAAEGKSRFDFSREELYGQVWDFVASNREKFETQLRRFGASTDWQHFTFTLDEKIVTRAYATFKKMFDEHLIYRGERLVNFCTFHGTSFSDIEVKFKEEQGMLWYIRYPLSDQKGEIIIATTRPETMLGDTGIAVHPDDPRYHAFVGKTAKLPLVGRDLPIIADEFVDKAFGTGAVKLTPAHDPNDYDAAKKHHLPMITVITHDGKIGGDVPDKYRGLSVLDARKKIIEDLTAQGLVVKQEEITHSVGHCYKCDTVIEPLLSEQWFIDMQPLAQKAIAALESNQITFYPATKKAQLISYMKQLKDWNISRQIAWGIPIPAFQNVDDPDDWIYNEQVEHELITIGNKTYRRDPDVFDTWFSSSSWPYATLNFPDSQDFKDFFPLSLMETGGEILYPWVSRMIMLGLYVTEKVPFESVYIHGYVLAEDGSKMSKSIGNVIDPLEIITKFGSDALRIGLINGRVPSVNRGYDPRKVEEGRNFCNKLWNIARFIEDRADINFKQAEHPKSQTPADHWILTKLQHTISEESEDLAHYRFSEAYERLYHFVWDDFADWYIEASKQEPNLSILGTCLVAILKLAHPFAPFVTETIWQTLGWETNSLLATSRWPEVPGGDPERYQEFEEVKNIITEMRYVINTLHLKKTKLHYIAPQHVKENSKLIERLTKVETVTEVQLGPGLRLVNNPYQCWLDVDSKTMKEYIATLAKKEQLQETLVAKLLARLANPSYTAKAPQEVIEQTKKDISDAQIVLETIKQEHQRFVPQQTVKPTEPQPQE